MSSSSLLLIITGASRGLGRAISLAFGQDKSLARIHAVLVARSAEGLQETTAQLKQLTTEGDGRLKLDVTQHPMDLSDLEHLDSNIDSLLNGLPSPSSETFDRIVFVNNAGALGYVGPTLSSPSLQSMKESVDFNITSSLWLSVRLTRHFQTNNNNTTATFTLVNISSAVAVKDLPTLAIYSAGKSARYRFHSILAQEHPSPQATTTTNNGNNNNSNNLTIKVLNYSPGPLETDMAAVVLGTPELDETVKISLQKQLIDPLDTARKLVGLVLTDSYTSGQHVDYFDE